MLLKDALKHFRNLESEATRKSEVRIYQKFIQVLTRLEDRDMSDDEVQSIEEALDAFDLNSTTTHSNGHWNKAFRQFEQFLKDTFSLTTKGYYTRLGMGLGASFGIVFGVVFFSDLERSLGISFGISIGMVIGLIIGHTLDSRAMASGRVI